MSENENENSSTVVANNDTEVVPGNGTAETGAVAPAEGQAAAQPARPNGWSMIKGFLFRLVIIYFVSSLFRRGQNPAPTDPGTTPGQVGPAQGGRGPGTNMFLKGDRLDMYVYVIEQDVLSDFSEKYLYWRKTEVVYGDWESGISGDGIYMKSGKITATPNLMNNGSLYIHVYMVRAGNSPDPKNKNNYSNKYTMYTTKMLTKYKSRKISQTVNLLTGETDGPKTDTPTNLTKLPPSTHWHPNLTIQLLDDHSPWIQGSVPPPLNDYIKFYPETNEYYPVVFINDYWNLQQDYMPINETTPLLNLSITFSPISLFRWQLYAAQTMRNKWYSSILGENMMHESDEEQDTLKKTLVETNPYLLGLTLIVSIVHSVFEFLAFKNDIQFWHTRESLEGLSVRSVFFNVFQSVIVVLYVMDNDTNFVVRVSVCIGLLIEIWKIKKVMNIGLDRENPLFGLPRPSISFKNTYSQTDTKKFDKLAFRYLSWLLYPLLVIYAVYSVVYLEHRSWYSWVLNMLYGFLLTFGFIMMTPQLFINYKLKSVAHLPWRMLTYKALNTFIDDIFAFVIKMPTLYRLGCLRDDVIFFIYLYQRYIYPCDPNRVNEYGTSQQMLDKRKAEINGSATSEGGDGVAAIENTQSPTEANNDENKKTK